MKRLARWALLGGSLAFLVVFFAQRREDLLLLTELPAAGAALLVALCVLHLLLQAWRYQLVLEQCGGRPLAWRAWLPLFVLGRFLNTVVPPSGNLYRAYELKRAHQLSYTHYVGAFFAVAWFDTCLNLVLATALVTAVDRAHRLVGLPTVALLGATAATAIVGPVVLHRLLRAIPGAGGKRLEWLRDRLEEALRVAVEGIADGRYMAKVILSGLAGFALAALILYYCFAALGVEAGLPQIAVFCVVLRLSNLVSLTPANLGVQEIGFGLLGKGLAYGMGPGILAAALLRVAGLLALVILALPMGGLRALRQARRLQPEA